MNNSQHPFGRSSIAQAVTAYDAACVKCVGQRGLEIIDSAKLAGLATISRRVCVPGGQMSEVVDYGNTVEYFIQALAKWEFVGNGNVRFYWAQRRSGILVVTHTSVWHVTDLLAQSPVIQSAAQAIAAQEQATFFGVAGLPSVGGH